MNVHYPVISGSGVEVYTVRLIAGVAPLGWCGRLLRFSPAWEYFPWGLSWTWKSSSKAKDCDLVHVNADYGCHFSVTNKPMVATLHHSAIDAPYLSSLSLPVGWHHRLVLKPSVAKTLRQANALVAVSQHTRDTICAVFQQEWPIRVIPNGIDTNRFRPNPSEPVPAELNQSKGRVVLFFSGNPSHRKGADLFVPVMKQLGSEFELRATGGLRSASASLFDAPNIRWLGRLSEDALIQQIKAADISFQPSRREGFGLSILEAMACGKPVVSSNVSAIPEVLEHEKGGYLCEPGSVDQLVNAIRRLAHSETLRRQMGQFNRRVVEEKFTLDRMAREYQAVYQAVAS
jgi:glycosyltransferase involved in cell wall biosynthesis